jgi:hypothetical protein
MPIKLSLSSFMRQTESYFLHDCFSSAYRNTHRRLDHPKPLGDNGSGHTQFSCQKAAEDASGCDTNGVLAVKKDFLRTHNLMGLGPTRSLLSIGSTMVR